MQMNSVDLAYNASHLCISIYHHHIRARKSLSKREIVRILNDGYTPTIIVCKHIFSTKAITINHLTHFILKIVIRSITETISLINSFLRAT